MYQERLLLTMQNNELVVYDVDSGKEDPFAKVSLKFHFFFLLVQFHLF